MANSINKPSNIYGRLVSRVYAELSVANHNSFASKIEPCHYQDYQTPSIKVSTYGNATIIYDIELEINAAVVAKWTKHSIRCTQLILVVPEHQVEYAKKICTSTFNNYAVKGYKIEPHGDDFIITITDE